MAKVAHYSSHWYEQIAPKGQLRQGDILRGVTVYWIEDSGGATPEDSYIDNDPDLCESNGNWIVLEASCDLAQQRCHQVLVARVAEASHDSLGTSTTKELKRRRECIRRGHYVTRFLLAELPHELPLSFADYNQRYLVPLHRLLRVQSVIRMKSPFRESFGNWVGACFSRIGPEDNALIPQFTSLQDEHRLQVVE